MKARDIERMLADTPAPPPPEGLAERIKDEIPDDIEIADEIRRDPTVLRLPRRRQLYLAAAAVLTVALTATVTWQLRQSGPSLEPFGPESMTTDKGEMRSTPPSLSAGGEDDQQAPSIPPQSESLRAGVGDGRTNEVDSDGGVDRYEVISGDAAEVLEEHRDDLSPEARRFLEELTEGEGDQISYYGSRRPRLESKRSADSPDSPFNRQEASVSTAKEKAGVTESQGSYASSSKQGADKGGEAAGRTAESPPARPRQESPDAVEVVADTPLIDTSSTVVTDMAIDPNELNDRVPVARESTQITLLVPADAEADRAAAPSNKKAEAKRRREPSPEELGALASRSRISVTEAASAVAPASTGGTDEPNDAPYGDNFFREYGVNPFIDTEDDNLSTFGLEVDTGSYTVLRRYLRDGNLPPREAVRVEELVNYFDYGDKPPRRDDFALIAEGAPSPFGESDRYALLRFAISAREVDADQRPTAILVFVVDTSGSMGQEGRLEMVKDALRELLGELRPDDRIGLVEYGDRGYVLEQPTRDHLAVLRAIDRLRPKGSTNAEEGLRLGYEMADRFFHEQAINRIILCSDGVANVGRTGPESILEVIERSAGGGIELTTVGFGMGNYNDVLMERLADSGDGRYAYVDTLSEARRIFVEELTGTLLTIGHDAKAQVEFNPDAVSRYRLIGYENRDIADERFRDPTVDAGEIGAGHTVTALYEVKLHPEARRRDTLATLRVRYRPTRYNRPEELARSIEVRDLAPSWAEASPSLQLASLVAEYGEILKGAYWAKSGDLGDVLDRARRLAADSRRDERLDDFVSLVSTANALMEAETRASRQAIEP